MFLQALPMNVKNTCRNRSLKSFALHILAIFFKLLKNIKLMQITEYVIKYGKKAFILQYKFIYRTKSFIILDNWFLNFDTQK